MVGIDLRKQFWFYLLAKSMGFCAFLVLIHDHDDIFVKKACLATLLWRLRDGGSMRKNEATLGARRRVLRLMANIPSLCVSSVANIVVVCLSCCCSQ